MQAQRHRGLKDTKRIRREPSARKTVSAARSTGPSWRGHGTDLQLEQQWPNRGETVLRVVRSISVGPVLDLDRRDAERPRARGRVWRGGPPLSGIRRRRDGVHGVGGIRDRRDHGHGDEERSAGKRPRAAGRARHGADRCGPGRTRIPGRARHGRQHRQGEDHRRRRRHGADLHGGGDAADGA